MAAQYDQLGNYLGDWESEEERLKREQEEANRTVQTQEVKTYGDGTVEETTKREIQPAQTTAIQPVQIKPIQQQPVAQPISPDTFNRMIQVESGGRNFDAQGRPLTSPAGAMFANQVMPATAAQPGFGVRPAQAQTPEEYNRVGADLYQALLRQFNGDERKAAAAYNAGYGRVQQNIAANQGQMNEAQLPQETQGYLQKVFSGLGNAVNAVIPSAQAGTVPAPRNVPQAFPGEGVAVATGRGVQGTQQTQAQMEAQRQLETASQQIQQNQQNQQQQTTVNRFVDLQDDDIGLMAVRNNDNATEFERRWAGDRLFDRMRRSVEEGRAKEQTKALVTAAGQGDRKASNALAQELQKQEGSWIKMLLLSFISPDMAGEEAVKLGYGNKWVQGYDSDGKSALMQVNAFGKPLQGFTPDGNAIETNDLAAYMTGGKAGTKADVSTQDVERNGQAGRVITQHMPNGQTKTMVESGGKLFPYDTSWKPRSIATSQAKADYGLITDLKKKHGTNVLDAEKDYVQLNGPFKSAEDRQEFRRVYGFDLAQPGGQAAGAGQVQGAPTGQVQGTVGGQAAGQVQGAPAGQATGTTATSNVSVPLQQQRDQAEARKTKLKEEAEVLGKDVGTTRANQGKAEQNADYLLTKVDEIVKHPGFKFSVGVADIGQNTLGFGIPVPFGATVAGAIPGTDVSNFNSRFKEIQGQSFLQAIENLRGMGALSNLEGESATKAIQRMNTSQSEKEFKEAARDFQEIIQRGIDRNRVKLGQEPKYGTKAESEQAKEKPTKKLSREEQQAVEWLRKNPDHPRAAEIRRELGL